jgi:hypothetical protein
MGYEDGLTIKKKSMKNELRQTISEWLLGLDPRDRKKGVLFSISDDLVKDEDREDT